MKKLYFVMALLIVASMVLTACGGKPMQPIVAGEPVQYSTDTQADPPCQPNPNQACAVVGAKTISGGQIASTYMFAKWVASEEIGSPAEIVVLYNFRGIENHKIAVQPNGQEDMTSGTFEDDVVVYAIEATGYTCDWRTNTNIIDCSKQ